MSAERLLKAVLLVLVLGALGFGPPAFALWIGIKAFGAFSNVLPYALERQLSVHRRRPWFDSPTASLGLLSGAASASLLAGFWIGVEVPFMIGVGVSGLALLTMVELVAWVHIPPAIVLLGASTQEHADMQQRLHAEYRPLRLNGTKISLV